MSTEDILDQEEPLQPPADPGLRRRAVRFLIYCLGIVGVLWYRYYQAVEAVRQTGDLDAGEISTLLQRVFPIGMAAVWLFSGLGLVAVVQAMSKQRPDFWWVILGGFHALLFLYYSFRLFVFFASWSPFSL